MAGPIGHIVCALALLNSPKIDIKDKDAFLAGTNFPDIRYITDINRSTTHRINERTLEFLKNADSSFEAGRRFHVIVDYAREQHMLKNGAYNFIKKGPLQSQILKLTEDDILFKKFKNSNFDTDQIFNNIYKEELSYDIKPDEIKRWHNILKNYLKKDQFFDLWRYYSAFSLFQNQRDIPEGFFAKAWSNVKKTVFFISVFFKIKWLGSDEKLKKIILDFYDHPIEIIFPEAIKKEIAFRLDVKWPYLFDNIDKLILSA